MSGHDPCFVDGTMCAEAWTALGTWVLAIATASLVGFGYLRTLKILQDAKISRSLTACERYDYDPVLDRCQRRLRNSEVVWKEPHRYRIDLVTILNFLDGLATGVREGTYDEFFVHTHMRSILTYHVENLLDDRVTSAFDVKRKDYENLLWLYDRWGEKGPYDDQIRWRAELAAADVRIAARKKAEAASWSAAKDS